MIVHEKERSHIVEGSKTGKRALRRGRSLIINQTEDRERIGKKRKRRGKLPDCPS